MSRERGADRGTPASDVPVRFAEHDGDRYTGWLRDRTGGDWAAATEHRFVHELGADELDDAVFRRYLVQDYAFVDALTSLFGHAAGDAPTVEARVELASFLETVGTDEDDYFRRSFDALDVPEADRTNPELRPPAASGTSSGTPRARDTPRRWPSSSRPSGSTWSGPPRRPRDRARTGSTSTSGSTSTRCQPSGSSSGGSADSSTPSARRCRHVANAAWTGCSAGRWSWKWPSSTLRTPTARSDGSARAQASSPSAASPRA